MRILKYVPFTLILLLFSCSSSTNDTDEIIPETEIEESFEERTLHEISTKLQLPATEKYTYRIYREYINSDTLQDAIVTVNRLQFAINESIRTGKQAKAAEVGYMGNFNFFFYYDGALDRFSVPLPVPSSPGRELDVSFESIVSPIRKDVVIDYRIRNSGWRSYFTVLNESDLTLMFQWKHFDKVGETPPEALLHNFETGQYSEARDICIYESKIDNLSSLTNDVYQFIPQITQKGKLLNRFFYDPKVAKYRLLK